MGFLSSWQLRYTHIKTYIDIFISMAGVKKSVDALVQAAAVTSVAIIDELGGGLPYRLAL